VCLREVGGFLVIDLQQYPLGVPEVWRINHCTIDLQDPGFRVICEGRDDASRALDERRDGVNAQWIAGIWVG